MPVLTEPLAAPTRSLLRRAVLAHVTSEHRRTFAPVLHVGTPGGRSHSLELAVPDRLGHGLCTDLVATLLARLERSQGAEPAQEGPADPPLVWLTRGGAHTLEDVDATWVAAATAAGAEAGIPVTVVVVTRQGWWDPRSGVRQEWRRLRQR